MKRFCTECGTEMPEQSKFCAACGHKMWAPDTIRPVEEAVPPVVPVVVAEEPSSPVTHQAVEAVPEVLPEKLEEPEHEYWMEMPEEMAELPSEIPPELLMMPGFHVFPEGEDEEESQDEDEEADLHEKNQRKISIDDEVFEFTFEKLESGKRFSLAHFLTEVVVAKEDVQGEFQVFTSYSKEPAEGSFEFSRKDILFTEIKKKISSVLVFGVMMFLGMIPVAVQFRDFDLTTLIPLLPALFFGLKAIHTKGLCLEVYLKSGETVKIFGKEAYEIERLKGLFDQSARQNVAEIDLSTIVQSETDYYLPVFREIQEGGKGKFKWTAFFFPPIQCLYRNSWKMMWKFMAIPLISNVVVLLAFILFVKLGFQNPDYVVLYGIFAVILSVGAMFICFSNALSCGKNFNRGYYHHCLKEYFKPYPKKGTSLGNIFKFVGLGAVVYLIFCGTVAWGVVSDLLNFFSEDLDLYLSPDNAVVEYEESYGDIDIFCREYEQLILRAEELNRYNESLEMSDTDANMNSMQQTISLFREFKYLNPPEDIAVNYEILSETCDLKADTMEEQYSMLEEFIASEERNDEQLQRFELMESEMEELSNIMDRVEPGITRFVENHLGRSITDIAPPVEEVAPEETPSSTQQSGNTQTGTSETATSRQEYIDYGEEILLLIYAYENFRGWEVAFNADPEGGMENDLIDAMNWFAQLSNNFSKPPSEWAIRHVLMLRKIETVLEGFDDIIGYIQEPHDYIQYEGGDKTLAYYGQAKNELQNIFDEFYFDILDKFDEIGYEIVIP